ncbi:MFS transporter [Desulfitobacterium chlororespirans]|uniref:MFS transporter, AAHS family, benzoate transport protein n=1 Tax=Desulfitobacterium chlororespirans DSM 11544 TaxID=1121395 RepID=A0A1M7TWP1_9FIRM|nr:MFS transporter [Desulfitobacterium chlororespirans]SHN75107.1 MFS transporter, AAHS family, benzoate transport protein [Desulfitobacterium chlororespirans DSM 11544]
MRQVNVNDVIDNSKMNNYFRSIWTIILFALIIDGFDQAVYGAALPMLMKDLNLSASVGGLLGSASLWGAVVGALLLGYLTDRVGRRKMIVVAVILYTSFTALCAIVAHDILLFATCRFLAGMGIAAITPIANSILSEFTPKSSRRFLLTSNIIGINIGQMVTSLIAIGLIPLIGWRGLFGISILGLVIIPFLLKIPETMVIALKKDPKSKIASVLTQADPSFVPQEDDEYVVDSVQTVKQSVTELFKGGLAWNTILIWIMFFVNMFIISSLLVWLPKIITLMGYSLNSALLLNSLLYLGLIFGGIVSGKIAQRFGYKKTLIFYYIVNAGFILLMTIKSTTTVFAVLLFLLGFTLCAQSLIYPFTSANYPMTIRGTGLGFGAGVTRLGGALSPIVIGIFVAQGMTPVDIFRFLLIPALVGLAASALTRKAAYD